MSLALFASDLHGRASRYDALFAAVAERRPSALFLGGDLLPGAFADPVPGGFVEGWLLPRLAELRRGSAGRAFRLFAIPGNDDAAFRDGAFAEAERRGLLTWLDGRVDEWDGRPVLGYSCVPPTPFLLKDRERYDVSRFVDPGCVSPEEGFHSVPFEAREARLATIARDLEALARGVDLSRGVCLFHAPPYRSRLDRAALDGRSVEHAPLDVHVGSVAIRRFLEARQPAVSLHGHVHESARLTGEFRDRIGRTLCLSAAHDGPELALVSFDPDDPAAASRELL
ncbi:MAG: metallophosphoesterase [Thermoanaerobaculia bacterium]